MGAAVTRARSTPTTPAMSPEGITVGVDTHAEQHVAAALDCHGRLVGTCVIPSSPAGYATLLAWASAYGPLARVGIEGTGSYGAGLARWLQRRGHIVVEVDRPNRRLRHRRGKSDPIDAEAAARAVLAGTAAGQPKSGDGQVEAIRVLRLARRSAMKARTQAMNQLHALVVTAPDALRERLRSLPPAALVTTAVRLRPQADGTPAVTATKLALKTLAQRYQTLTQELAARDEQLEHLVRAKAPQLVAIKGVGTDTAGALVVAAGDNPDRLHSEAAFAQLCGVAPIPASSGKTQRHRRNRGGDREANRALYLLAIGRLGWDDRTRDYAERRTQAGKTKPEIIRCLKRFIAREIYHALVATVA